MANLEIRYRTAGKALPPRAIRLSIPGWAGAAEKKMENGSEPQPWHCRPFVQGATYGGELVYQYETECQVLNDDGEIRFQWDYRKEPGGVVGSDEFGLTEPRPSQFYTFTTSLDIQAPPGYALCTLPHPRFYTDLTGTVPIALIGHIETDWWPRKFFTVFKVPAPGQRNIFRKGEPYAQVLFLPIDSRYEFTRMSAEEAAHRQKLEDTVIRAKSHIAKNVWLNPSGGEFSDHYKVLERAYERGGVEAVEQLVNEAGERQQRSLPMGKTIPEYLSLAARYQSEGRHLEARDVCFHILRLDPSNAQAASGLGKVATALNLPTLALKAMNRAVALQPASVAYRMDLGETLARLGRNQEAEASFRSALKHAPHDPLILSNLGVAVAQQGRGAEAIELCRAAMAHGTGVAVVQHRTGLVLMRNGQYSEARACFEAALSLDPAFTEAREHLNGLTESGQKATGFASEEKSKLPSATNSPTDPMP